MLLLFYHYTFITEILPEVRLVKDNEFTGYARIKQDTKFISGYYFVTIKESVISFYNDKDTYGTKANKRYNIFSEKIKMTLSEVELTSLEAQKYEEYYKINMSQDFGYKKLSIDLFFDNYADKTRFMNAITKTEKEEYGDQTDGSVIVTQSQDEIEKLILEADKNDKIIKKGGLPLAEISKLMKLRRKIADKIKIIESKGLKTNIKKCECSYTNVYLLLYYLNTIIPYFLILTYTFRYMNINVLTNNMFSNTIGTLLKVLYTGFFMLGCVYHTYLLTNCRCALPSLADKSQSFTFMIIFAFIIILKTMHAYSIR